MFVFLQIVSCNVLYDFINFNKLCNWTDMTGYSDKMWMVVSVRNIALFQRKLLHFLNRVRSFLAVLSAPVEPLFVFLQAMDHWVSCRVF